MDTGSKPWNPKFVRIFSRLQVLVPNSGLITSRILIEEGVVKKVVVE